MILHEEAEDGNAMPDLSRPVDAVSKAVANLVKVCWDLYVFKVTKYDDSASSFKVIKILMLVSTGWEGNNQ